MHGVLHRIRFEKPGKKEELGFAYSWKKQYFNLLFEIP